MKPFVISTPRTGSSLFTHMLFELCIKNWGYRSNLGEYFSEYRRAFENSGINVSEVLPYYYRVEDGVIKKKPRDTGWDPTIVLGGTDVKLRELSSVDDRHLIKAHSFDLKPPILEFLRTRQYTIFYLERRNKLNQFLSFLSSWQHDKWHFNDSDSYISSIRFKEEIWTRFKRYLISFYQLKSNLQIENYTVYYEDFLECGGDQFSILKLTGISAMINDRCRPWRWVPSKYSGDLERLIQNQDEWLHYKPKIIEQLYTIEHHDTL